jgi:putative ABC transport system substrate-binding protein
LGWIEGHNLKVERYGREQNTSGPEALAAEIVRSNPDVIHVVGPGAVIFKKLASRIPIVVITSDPVKQGIAESLAHPGGNFTGASVDIGPSIYGKRFALLREMVPTSAAPFTCSRSMIVLLCCLRHEQRKSYAVVPSKTCAGLTHDDF